MDKKHIPIIVAAAAALVLAASCLEVEPVPSPSAGGALSVSPVLSRGTKAPIEGTVYPTTRGVVLSASSSSAGDWFTDVPFTYSAGKWRPSTPKHWPHAGTLSFLGWSADGLAVTAAHGPAAADSVRLTVPDNGSVQVDIVAGAAADRARTAGDVPLVMRHALSMVSFTAAASDAYDAVANTGVTFDGVTLLDAANGGSCKVTRSGSSVTFAWSDLTARRDVDFLGAADTHLGTSPTNVGDGFMVPPQAATAIKVSYRLHGGRDSGGNPVDTPLEYVYLASGDWQAGYMYNYDLTIGLGGILVRATVDEWLVQGDWFYATGDTVDEVGSSFSFSQQTVWRWRETAEEPYQPLVFEGGTWGDEVRFLCGGSSVTLAREGGAYVVSHYNIALNTPLTLSALSAGVFSSTVPGLEYSFDGDTWTEYAGEVAVGKDTRIMLRSETPFTNRRIHFDGNYNVSGNIMSLLSKTGFASLVSAPDSVFMNLFREEAHMVSAAGLTMPSASIGKLSCSGMFYGCITLTTPPALPATTVGERGYQSMFYRCKHLKAAPNLPAAAIGPYGYCQMFYQCENMLTPPERIGAETSFTSGSYHCYYMFYQCAKMVAPPELPALKAGAYTYSYMFFGCSSMQEAPELPATSIGSASYYYMFQGCTSLTEAPDIKAVTVSSSSFAAMFNGCTGLVTPPPVLRPATLYSSTCSSMFSGCSKLASAPEILATTYSTESLRSMFNGCTSLVAGPVVRGAVLPAECCSTMFNNCANLTSLTLLATDFSAYNCVYNMLAGVTAAGVLTLSEGVTLPDGVLPASWTVTYAAP